MSLFSSAISPSSNETEGVYEKYFPHSPSYSKTWVHLDEITLLLNFNLKILDEITNRLPFL